VQHRRKRNLMYKATLAQMSLNFWAGKKSSREWSKVMRSLAITQNLSTNKCENHFSSKNSEGKEQKFCFCKDREFDGTSGEVHSTLKR